jgi:predicted transcriptional regulator
MTGTRNTPSGTRREWTFLTNHAHVLICVHEDPSSRTRDIAVRVGITERAVQRIISDLCEAGFLTREREGRRNRYAVHAESPLRHPVEAHCLLSGLLKTVEESEGA